MNEKTLNNLEHSNRVLASTIAHLTLVERANLPQFLNLDALTDRYALDDAQQTRALLEKHRVPSLPHGKGLRVHIDDVLRLDATLSQEIPRRTA